MPFHLSIRTVICASQNRGIPYIRIKNRGKHAKSKKKMDKCEVRGEASYAIAPSFLKRNFSNLEEALTTSSTILLLECVAEYVVRREKVGVS